MEDTAFYHSILTALGTRQTADRSSLTATRAVGGLQLRSTVEAVVSDVANGIMYLLNGDTTASKIARHALNISMFEDPSKVSMDFGTVNRCRAIAFMYVHPRIDLSAEC